MAQLRADAPAPRGRFDCGSDFYVHLCCAATWPWFMLGRISHRLRIPAPLLAFPVMAALALYTGALSLYGYVGHEWAFVGGGVALFAVTTAAVAVLRHEFRGALGVPGTWCGDFKMSCACGTISVALVIFVVAALVNIYTTPRSAQQGENDARGAAFTALIFSACVFPIAFSLPPCYAPPSSCPDQCTPAFQLALMESALEQPAAPALAQGAHSGMDKGTAPLLPAQPPPLPPARQGAWSTGLCECTCTPHCEGNMPLFCCSLAWGWWMQARAMRRLGWFSSQADFARVAGILCCLQGLPAAWSGVAALVHATGVAVQVVYCIAALPALVAACWLRRQVRERYGIAGANACEDVLCEDFLKPTLCFPCSIAQLDRELTLRGEAGSSF